MATHRVARQTIEIVARDATLARALADRTSAAAATLAATLTRALDAADPGRRLRLDRLALDLAPCDPVHWEASLAVNLQAALARALPRALAAADAPSPAEEAFDLLAAFVRDGALPWWADPARTVLDDAATTLAAADDPGLRAALRRLLASSDAAARLARQLAPDALAALVARMTGVPATGLAAGAARLAALASATGLAGGPSGVAVWCTLLAVAADPPVGAGDPAAGAGAGDPTAGATEALWRTALAALAANASTDPEAAIAALHAADAAADIPPVAALTLALRTLASGGEARRFPRAQREGDPRSGGGRIARDDGPAPEDEAKPLPRAAVLDLAALARPASQAHEPQAPLAAGAGEDRAKQGGEAVERLAAVPLPTAPAPLRGPAPEQAGGERSLSDRAGSSSAADDSLAVPTAGLVLLWPFLPAYFAAAGLLDDANAFVSEPARHRAAALLDHLATGERLAPEPRLPLAKLLAGLAPDTVHDPDPRIDDAAAEAADALLDAVLGHAPMLGRLSRDGFRASYLLRPGTLATRHGHWLLRVERRTFDLLLDRLPWTFGWLRLPWMPDPLAVEW